MSPARFLKLPIASSGALVLLGGAYGLTNDVHAFVSSFAGGRAWLAFVAALLWVSGALMRGAKDHVKAGHPFAAALAAMSALALVAVAAISYAPSVEENLRHVVAATVLIVALTGYLIVGIAGSALQTTPATRPLAVAYVTVLTGFGAAEWTVFGSDHITALTVTQGNPLPMYEAALLFTLLLVGSTVEARKCAVTDDKQSGPR